MSNSLKKVQFSSVILWSSLCLILVHTTVSHNYEKDVPPYVSPHVYSPHHEDGEDHDVVSSEVESQNQEDPRMPPFVSPDVYRHEHEDSKTAPTASQEEAHLYTEENGNFHPPVSPEVIVHIQERNNTQSLGSPVVHSKDEEDETDLENEAAEDKDSALQWNADQIAEERDHIQEHLDVPTMDTSKMTGEELQFHYFKMHDIDQNNYLDGLELMKTIIHWHEGQMRRMKLQNEVHGHKNAKPSSGKEAPELPEIKIWSDFDLANLVDPILHLHDINRDGLIDYKEYKSSLHHHGLRRQ